MSKEIITGDGRIFKQTGGETFRELGGKKSEVSVAQIKQYERYTGVKAVDLKESSRNNPQFTQIMYDKAKNS